jgi:microcystin-dependent protein
MQNIINIVLFLAVIYIIFRLPSMEQMSNIDLATENKIREIYKIDTDAIRNLSNLAKDLTVNNKLKVPGGLEIDGALNFLPKGCIIAWTGTTAPAGWALCNGENGTPDLRGRFILGLGHSQGLSDRPINQRGGAETHTLTVNEIPAHNHTMNNAGDHSHTFNDAYFAEAWGPEKKWGNNLAGSNKGADSDNAVWTVSNNTNTTGNHTHTINNNGGGQPHNNMPPYHVLAYIMRL